MANREFKRKIHQLGHKKVYFDAFADMLGEAEGAVVDPKIRDELSWRKKVAREGNPFPFIAFQWPHLVAKSEYFHDYFEGKVGDEEDPCLLIEEWQRKIILASVDNTIGEVAIAGCTGAGKGAVVGGICLNLIFDVNREARIHITSETFEHAKTNMYREFCIWRDKMVAPAPAYVGTQGASLGQEKYVKILNPKQTSGEAFSGRHGSSSIYVFDESSALPLIFKENADKNATKIFALSNPRVVHHWFRDMFGGFEEAGGLEGVHIGYKSGNRTRMLCVTVGGLNCSNVKHNRLKFPVAPPGGIIIKETEYNQGEKIPEHHYELVRPLIPQAMDLAQFRMIMSDPEEWKRNCFGHGKFIPEDVEKQIILKSWLKLHFDAYQEYVKSYHAIEAFSFDPARSTTGDDCVLAAGGTGGVDKLYAWKGDGTYKTSAEKIIRIAEADYEVDLTKGGKPVVIDFGGGYGAGVADWLREAGVWVYQFEPGGSAGYYPRTYVNLRAEAYSLLGRRFNPADYWEGIPWAMPYTERLQEELVVPTKIHPANDDTRYAIEPKREIKDKLGRSPDYADAVVMLYYYIFELNQYHKVMSKVNMQGLTYPQQGDKGYESINVSGGGAADTEVKKDESLEDYMKRAYGNLL